MFCCLDLMSEEAFGELVNETYGHSHIQEELDEGNQEDNKQRLKFFVNGFVACFEIAEELDKQIN